MIRPSLTGCTANDEWSDQEAANTIEEHIMKLGVITKFSVNFDVDTVHEFYGGQPKEVQLGLQPERYPEYETRWHEFVDLMCSGPTTVILLHSTNGDAIRLWRDQVGHYDIVKRRDPSTIRGTFGKDNYNNLIHGSDSIEAVKKEIAIISKLLGRF
jgi:nucleoside diphosphate kinase